MRDIAIRFFIVFFLSSFWMAYRILYLKEDKSSWNYKECVYDHVLDNIFNQSTIYISQHLNMRDMLLIISGSLSDIYLLNFLYAFYISGKSLKPLFHILIFYLIKLCILDQIFRFKILETILFDSPGIESLTFDYGRKPYTFYSEYSGLPLILSLQFKNLGYHSFSIFGIFLTAVNSFVVIITRKNNIVDVLFGILAAHYFYLLAEKLDITNHILKNTTVQGEVTNKKEISIEFENKNIIDNRVEIA